ncbi:MAG: hypothetical protein UFJ18_15815 [Blautia sp.]|nr:hypothetical protein [Blautia sp.]
MRRRGKTFLSLLISAVIVTGQPVLAADFSAGEETFISETTEQEGDVSEALTIFENDVEAGNTKEYEATVSEEVCDLGQCGEKYDDWTLNESIEIKNTGTKAWHIKSISDLKYFQRYSSLDGKIPLKVGNKVEPGECTGTEFYLKANLPKGIYEETFVMETEEGIQAKCRVRVCIGGASAQDYEIVCEPSNGTSFPVITQEEYDSWDDVEPEPDMLMCPTRSILIRNNGQKPVTVDFESTEHFWAGFYNQEPTKVIMPGESKEIVLDPKAEEQVATDIFKVSITGGIELSYTISQNCPHIAPPYPEGATLKDVKVQGSTIKAVAYDCANSEGFDAVLTKKSWVDRPENYVKVAKNQDAKTITFTNVKNGTYYLGIHAYNRDYYDGKVSGKRFGAWSYPVKVEVKNGIPTEKVKIKTVKTGKGAVSVTVGVPKGFARADMELRSTGGTTVYKRNNRTTYTRITGVKPGIYTLRVRPWLKINGRKAYGDWVSWGRRIRVK